MSYPEMRYSCHNHNCRNQFDQPRGEWVGAMTRMYIERCPKCGTTHIYDRWAAEDRRLKSYYKEYKKDALNFNVFEVLFLKIPVMCIIWGITCILMGFSGPGWVFGIPVIIGIAILFEYGDFLFDLLRFKGKIPRNMDIEGVTPRGYD